MILWLTTITFLTFVLLTIVHYILSVFLKYRQLLKEYRNISLLSGSCIRFIGNLHQIAKLPNVFFQLICRLVKQSQVQSNDLFLSLVFIMTNGVLSCSRLLEVNTWL
jgi:hypothetical protein